MKTKKIPNSSGSHIKFMVCVFGFVVIFLFAPTIYINYLDSQQRTPIA